MAGSIDSLQPPNVPSQVHSVRLKSPALAQQDSVSKGVTDKRKDSKKKCELMLYVRTYVHIHMYVFTLCDFQLNSTNLISNPVDLEHTIHVGYDPVTKEFTVSAGYRTLRWE